MKSAQHPAFGGEDMVLLDQIVHHAVCPQIILAEGLRKKTPMVTTP